MEAWTTFWGWLLVIVLLIYAGLAVAITNGGFLDVKAMLSTIDDRHDSKNTTKRDGESDRS